MTWDLAEVWLEVAPDIIVPALVADFIYSYLQWVSDGECGTFQAAPPLGWDQQDLCTLGYLLANKEFPSARGLLESMLSPPMVMLPSSSLMEANDNYLLKNPFRVRKRRHKNKTKDTRVDVDEVEVHAGDSLAKQDPLPDDGETKQDLPAGDDKDKQNLLSCDEGDGGKDVDDNICDDGDSSKDCGNDTSDDKYDSKEGGDDNDSKEGGDHDDSKEGGDDDDSKEGGDDDDSKEGGDHDDSKEGGDDFDSNNGCRGVTRKRRSVSLKKGKEACAIIRIPTLDRYAQVKNQNKIVFHCQPILESLLGLAFN